MTVSRPFAPGDCVRVCRGSYSLWDLPRSPHEQHALFGLDVGQVGLVIDTASRSSRGQLFVVISGVLGYVSDECCERLS